ncbi:hypothetical protein CR513_09467, partial [Mucuna pruriens]
MDQSMIVAASGGALMDKMPVATRHLISNMASNTQRFRIRGANQPRMVNEISVFNNLRLENQLTKLTSLVRQLSVGQHRPSIAARVCGVCTFVEHPTDMCPILQETELDHLESVGAIGGYQNGNWSFDNQQFGKQPFRPRPSTTIPAVETTESSCSRKLTIFGGPNEVVSHKQPGVPTKHELQQYVLLAKHECHHSRHQGANRTVITLRSGKELPQPALQQMSRLTDADFEPDADSQMPQQDNFVPLPFPTQALSVRKPKIDEELLKMFQKVEINIPLLDAIKQIPKYTKFLKELCVHKRKKIKGRVELGGIVSALIRNEDFTARTQRALPKKF